MRRTITSLAFLLMAAFPCAVGSQQGGRPRDNGNKQNANENTAPQAKPEQKPQPQHQPPPQPQAQPVSRPIPQTRPAASSNFSVPRTVRPSTPIEQWNENRAVQINVSQPSGSWNVDENPPQVQVEFMPRDLAPGSDNTLAVNPAPPAETVPALTSRAPHQHHPYQPGYVRKKLQKLGVARIPYPLTDRSQFLDDDRAHSIIQTPRKGPDHQLLTAQALSPREYNDQLVRGPMSLVDQDDWRQSINHLNLTETKPNHYYWHKAKGFDYCHYLDVSGNHWYGWYSGNNYFWTRCYGDLWWWYDSDFNRWCFWNEGWWWWQDPYHVGDLYFYAGDQYIPCNSANDQVEVTTADTPHPSIFVNDESTRRITVMGKDQDTFLYDTAVPASFKPVYLASKVQNVEFKSPDEGGAEEIDLTLSDGTMNVFDLQGNPLETTVNSAAHLSPDDGAGTMPLTNQ